MPKRNKNCRNGTKSDETEQKVAKRTLLYGNINKIDETEQKVVKRTLINANINRK